MASDLSTRLRTLGQQYAYDTIRMHETIARKLGLSGTDHKYLGFLLVRGRVTAGELAALSGLTTGAVTGLIDRFEKKKLVKRQYDPNDRRKVFIEPNTRSIMALLEPVFVEFGKKTEALIDSFPERDKKVIETYLMKLISLTSETTSLHLGATKPAKK